MDYNDGAVKDITSIEDKKKAAKDFAEGNERLEELLNNLFDDGIITIACCGGHDDTKHGEPYLTFQLVKQNEYAINGMINDLLALGFKLEFSSSSNFEYPSFTIRFENNLMSYEDFFKCINQSYLKNKDKKVARSELNSVIKKIYNLTLSNSDDFNADITYSDNRYNLIISSDGFYEVVALDSKNINLYLDGLISNIFNYSDNISLKKYDSKEIQEKRWQKFLDFLKVNKITLKDYKMFDLLNLSGTKVLDQEIKCELDVSNENSIFEISKKLFLLGRFQRINAKAVINGISIDNTKKIHRIDEQGDDVYFPDFNIYDCIKEYENKVLRFLNENYFNNELIKCDDSPFSVVYFNNPTLTKEELFSRIEILKKYKLDVILNHQDYYFGIGTLEDKGVEELSVSKLIEDVGFIISGVNNQDIVYELLKIYQTICNDNSLSDNNKGRIISYYNLLNDYLNPYSQLEAKRNGLGKYLFMTKTNDLSLDDYLVISTLMPLIENSKTIVEDTRYLDYLLNLINDENSSSLIIQLYINYMNKINNEKGVSK